MRREPLDTHPGDAPLPPPARRSKAPAWCSSSMTRGPAPLDRACGRIAGDDGHTIGRRSRPAAHRDHAERPHHEHHEARGDVHEEPSCRDGGHGRSISARPAGPRYDERLSLVAWRPRRPLGANERGARGGTPPRAPASAGSDYLDEISSSRSRPRSRTVAWCTPGRPWELRRPHGHTRTPGISRGWGRLSGTPCRLRH